MDEERFLAVVRREGGDEAVTAAPAVLRTLAERLTGGLVDGIRGQLPRGLACELRPAVSRSSFEVEEFVRRVSERAVAGPGPAELYSGAVLVALGRAVEPADFRAVLAELGDGYGRLTAHA